MATAKIKAKFVEPMLLLRSAELPDDEGWLKEIKLDGYRCLAIKTGGKVDLRSRNDNDFNGISRHHKALAPMPDDTVIDGEVVAIDDSGQPSFNPLQNYGKAGTPLFDHAFDLLVLAGQDVMCETLVARRGFLEEACYPNWTTLSDTPRCSTAALKTS